MANESQAIVIIGATFAFAGMAWFSAMPRQTDYCDRQIVLYVPMPAPEPLKMPMSLPEIDKMPVVIPTQETKVAAREADPEPMAEESAVVERGRRHRYYRRHWRRHWR
jgi:hypothetical protein